MDNFIMVEKTELDLLCRSLKAAGETLGRIQGRDGYHEQMQKQIKLSKGGDAQNNITNISDYKITEITEKTFKISDDDKIKGDSQQMPYLKEGTLFKRWDGRWEARLMVNGKQRTIATKKRQEDAYKALINTIKLKKQNKLTNNKKTIYTTCSWIEYWWAIYKFNGNKLAIKTKNQYIRILHELKRGLPNKLISGLELIDMESYFIKMTASRSKELAYTLIKNCFTKAYEVGITKVNLMANISKPKYEKQTGRNLHSYELDKIYSACDTQEKHDMVHFYLHTGCRASEIGRVKCEHINLTNKNKLITNLYYKDKKLPDILLYPNEILIYGTKNKTSVRKMPIFKPLIKLLGLRIIANNEYLFPMTEGQRRGYYEKIKEKSGISFTLKDFRHTCATNCKDLGIPTSVYYSWFGWADETMAKKVYTHITEKDNKKAHEWATKFVYSATKNATKN